MIALIGAGPLGIELAVALKQAGIPYTHVEAGQIGSTMQWWAPGTRWFSSNDRIAIAGVPLVTPDQEKATREEYLAYLRSVVVQFALDIRTHTRVTHLQPTKSGFTLKIQRQQGDTPLGPEQTLKVKKVILATGGTAYPNLVEIPGEDLPHVSHYFQDPHLYFQKNLLIVGGRNSAVEAALRCCRAGAKVHFSYRGPRVDAEAIKYWLYPEFSSLLKSGHIAGHFHTVLTKITPTHVTLAPTDDPPPHSRTTNLPADFILLLTGYHADMSLAREAGVQLTGRNELPSINSDTMETNIPGLYIAGTAVAGTQFRYKVFLENCHIHIPRIIAHLTGKKPPPTPEKKSEALET